MKTINDRHSIKALLFDIIFDDERRAGELYEDVRQLHYLELEKVISQCLDQFVGPGEFAQLKVIELDLGKIHYRDLNSQLAQRLYTTLTEKLRFVFSQEQMGDRPVIASTWTRLDLIRHYLEEAYLPWNAQQNAETLFLEGLSREPASLAEVLREIGHSESIRRRLVARFGSPEIMGKMMAALQPSHSTLILLFYRKLSSVIQERKYFKVNTHQLENNIWLFMLNHLLLQTHPVTHINQLVKAVLLQFAEKYQVPFDDLIRLFWESLKQSKEAKYSRLQNILSELSAALHLELDQPKVQAKKFVELSREEQNQVLWEFLRTESVDPKIKGWDPIRLQSHFQWLLQEHPATVISFLKALNKTAEPIKVMVKHFNRKAIADLVRTLDGSHYRLISKYHTDVLVIHRKEPLVMISEKSFSSTLWELILQLLVNRTGSHFNQKAFLKQLIQQVSARYNLNFHELVRQFYHIAHLISGQSNRLPQFVLLITEIHQDENAVIGEVRSNQAPAPTHIQGYNEDSKRMESDPNESLKHPLELWKQYVKSSLSAQQLKVLRRYIWQKLPVDPEPILQEIKNPKIFLTLLHRLTNDFEVAFIHLFIQSIEPTHFYAILDYQKQIIRVQKSEPILRTSELELSNALWTLILKLLLSRTSSHFNRKAFLKQLLLQTAAHYNSDYIALMDQLCKAAQVAHYTSPDLQAFLQLVQEIRNEEKAAADSVVESEKRIDKASDSGSKENRPRGASDKMTDDLVSLVVLSSPDQPDLLRKRGFTSLEEAITYLNYYHRASLFSYLERHPVSVRQAFVKQLSATNTQQLWQDMRGNRTQIVRQLLSTLDQRLEQSAFRDRELVLNGCRQEALLFALDRTAQPIDHLLERLEKVLDRFHFPDGFFVGPETWQIPASGRLDQNIAALENRIKRSLEDEQTHHSQTKMLLEDIVRNNFRESDGIAYATEKSEIMPEIYVTNGGLVILQAYLSYFFERCELTNDEGFVSLEAQQRAALLLQYVLEPEGPFFEEDLVLNKLLCGLSLQEFLPGEFDVTTLEQEVASQMLDAIIMHWELIKNSSQEGFRESWLRREGKLSKKEKHWELLIEQRSFDVLLDYKPFSISPIQFSWMEMPIKVIWR